MSARSNLMSCSTSTESSHEALLRNISDKNIQGVRTIIEQNPNLLIKKHDVSPYYILYGICCKKIKADIETIDCLVNLGAKLLQLYDESLNGEEAIHFATRGQDPQILVLIIEHYQREGLDINATNINDETALLVLIKEGNSNNEGFNECAEILLESGIDFNKTDQIDRPAIYWAFKNGYIIIAQLLLSRKHIDIDSYNLKYGNIRNLIKNDVDVKNIALYNRESSELLLGYIKQSKTKNFIDLASESGVLDNEKNCKTFLQYACERNLFEVVKFLISKGVEIDKVRKYPASPLKIAAMKGFHLIFKELINQPNIDISDDIASIIIKQIDAKKTGQVDYNKCFQVLLLNDKIDVNKIDKNLNYLLHYAARYGENELIVSLLNKNASLANRNNFDILNVNNIDYVILNQHFNNCIGKEPNEFLDKDNDVITFNYTTLIPTDNSSSFNIDQEAQICSNHVSPRTNLLVHIGKSPELKTLLTHPLLSSFLYMKWYSIRWIFYINLGVYVSFLISLIAFSYFSKGNQQDNGIWWWFLLVTTGFLFLKETFQLYFMRINYILKIDNYFKIGLIISIGFMLYFHCTNNNDQLKPYYTQCKASSYVLAALELLFLLGTYPNLSTSISMLRTVSYTFLKFLMLYIFIIIGFAFSFHTLFNQSDNNNGTKCEQAINKTEEITNAKFFKDIFVSLFKTMIMMTGEFGAEPLMFATVASHLIFLAFVIGIAIILMNLLNGLAISDVQTIQNEAEMIGRIECAKYVANVESILYRSTILKPVAKIMLFQKYLTNGTLKVYPFQKGQVVPCESNIWIWKNIYLNKVIISRAVAILKDRKAIIKDNKEKEKLVQMQFDIHKMQKEILEKVNLLQVENK